MHIGMIYGENRHFPPDIRLEKEIRALCSAGHRVTVLSKRLDNSIPEKERVLHENASVIRKYICNESSKLKLIIDRVQLRQSNWVNEIINFTKTERPDVLHVHDFLMVPTVIDIAEKISVPVVADLHENMPAAVRAYRAGYSSFGKLKSAILNNYYLMRWHEKRYLSRCERIIVVVPEAAERLYKYGINPENIIVVSNTEDETTFRFKPEDAERIILENYSSRWAASYIGGIGPHRGLDTVLNAVPYIVTAIPNFLLLIVGANDYDYAVIQDYVRKINISTHVEVIGWQPFSKVNSYVMASNVCLVPHNNFEHTNTTVPHKLFQYMICKKPVLVSSCAPLARIIGDTKAGLIFEANNSQDFAKIILFMHDNPSLLVEMGENGQRAALGKYAWRNDAARLVDMYNELELKIKGR